MQIKKQRMGPFGTNCYLVWDQASGEGMLLDPAGRPQRIEEILQGFAGKLKYVVLTHGHADHVAGLGTVKAKTGAPILMHADDAPMLQDNDDVVARYVGIEKALPLPDQLLRGGEQLQLGDLQFTVLHTPGHTPGGICLFGNGVLFSGDTLFAGSIGRYDLPGGDLATLRRSLANLMQLPEATVVYPGHGPETTIAEEKASNRFLK